MASENYTFFLTIGNFVFFILCVTIAIYVYNYKYKKMEKIALQTQSDLYKDLALSQNGKSHSF
jgi:hypothetical protein